MIKKVNFVFPNVPHILSGGLKMVFEYSNRLAARGYEVGIIFNCDWGFFHTRMYIPYFIKRYLLYPILIKYHPRWFKLDSRVKKSFVTKIVDEEMPEADVIIATAVMTAPQVAKLSASKGKKVYFIQGFENWSKEWPAERVMRTYRLGMKNIVVTSWLENKVTEAGGTCVIIPNGLDFSVFNIDIPIRKRKGHIISMLYHEAPIKGTKYGLEVLKRVKEKYPDLEVYLFGTPARNQDIPEWMHYTQYATEAQLRQIYNKSIIYLCPSLEESFGLTGAEAMACGAAYVSSDYGGVHEYTKDKRNVLLSAPGNVDALFEHISFLFEYPEERIRLAENGYHDIQAFSWEKALDKFEEILWS